MHTVAVVVAMVVGVFGVDAMTGQVIPPCVRSGVAAPDSATRKPDLRVIFAPPRMSDKYCDSIVVVGIRSNARGNVDSITVSGISDIAYIKRVRTVFSKLVYCPALDHGRPTTGWDSLKIMEPRTKRGGT